MQPSVRSDLVAPLQGYLELLDRWNRIHALTSLPAAARWTELVLDSSALLSHLETLPPGSLVVDLGTGMGMPAVVLALARPDLNVLGVDSTRKKIAFLRQVALELGIRNLEPECARFEDLPCLEADVGVAKALAPLDRLLAWWDPLGKPGAPFLALKGPGDPGPPPRGWKLTNHPYELPGRGARQVIEARRTA